MKVLLHSLVHTTNKTINIKMLSITEQIQTFSSAFHPFKNLTISNFQLGTYKSRSHLQTRMNSTKSYPVTIPTSINHPSLINSHQVYIWIQSKLTKMKLYYKKDLHNKFMNLNLRSDEIRITLMSKRHKGRES